MNLRKINVLSTIILIIISICYVQIGCKKNQLSSIKSDKQTLIDFRALADLEDTTSEFSQVILRMELFKTHSDILKHNIGTPEEHQKRINYYITEFKNDIFLISANDTIACYDAHAERLYIDLPYMNFILTVLIMKKN
ncbi:MAG: hypothetical protein IPG95_14780 [Saprospiraceae bacterium]|nr:hypothetical protein [Saprospiraceae bacterium]